MKTIRTVLSTALAAFVAAATGAAAVTPEGPVSVRFVQPERFADVRDRANAFDPARDAYLTDLQAWIERRAMPLLASGQRLEVSVTDIDMAGDFEPLRRAPSDSPRIVRNVTTPRIDLDFKLLAADGQVLKSGSRKLRDLAFLSRFPESRNEPMRFEKALLADWMTRELR